MIWKLLHSACLQSPRMSLVTQNALPATKEMFKQESLRFEPQHLTDSHVVLHMNSWPSLEWFIQVICSLLCGLLFAVLYLKCLSSLYVLDDNCSLDTRLFSCFLPFLFLRLPLQSVDSCPSCEETFPFDTIRLVSFILLPIFQGLNPRNNHGFCN